MERLSEIFSIITAILAVIGGGGIVALLRVRAQNRKEKAETALIHDQLNQAAFDRTADIIKYYAEALHGAEERLSECQQALEEAQKETGGEQ